MKYTPSLELKMRDFYKDYYLNDLALQDWNYRFESYRINEEEIVGKKLITALTLAGVDFKDKKCLILGAGTGAEGFYLSSQFPTSEVTFLEPNDVAIKILTEKAQLFGLPASRIIQGVGEKLPFEDGSFDYVICYTVLEHVQDVEKTITEISRVIKKEGQGIVVAPNYAYPEEPHYKVRTFPPAYFKLLVKLHLKWIGRYTGFFETLNFFTPGKIKQILKKNRIAYREMNDLFPPANVGIIGLFTTLFRIKRNQCFLIYSSKRTHNS